MLAWLPERMIYGRPRIIGVCIASGKTVAEARDRHYHNPPDYLVLEPQDTSERTRNLRQSNTNGYKFQGSTGQLREAEKIMKTWGKHGRDYKLSFEYQTKLKQLLARFPYRLDTNYAKMDRIQHPGIEAFKKRIRKKILHGKSVSEWTRVLTGVNEAAIRDAAEILGIRDSGTSVLAR